MDTFLVGIIGTGKYAAFTQRHSVCPIPEPQRWTHVLCLHGTGIIEANGHCGVIERTLESFAEDCRYCTVAIYPHSFNVDELRKYLGQEFGYGKFSQMAHNELVAGDGMTCGELLALCDGGELIRMTGWQGKDIRPVDIQMAFWNRTGAYLKAGAIWGS